MGGGGGDPGFKPKPPPEFFLRKDIRGGEVKGSEMKTQVDEEDTS